jgi:hypothetical protein
MQIQYSKGATASRDQPLSTPQLQSSLDPRNNMIAILSIVAVALAVRVEAMESFREYVETNNRSALLCSEDVQRMLIGSGITESCLASDDYSFICSTCGEQMYQYGLQCVGESFGESINAGCSQDRTGRHCGAVFTDDHASYDQAVALCGRENCTLECNATIEGLKRNFDCCSSVRTVYALDHEWEDEIPAILRRCNASLKPVCEVPFPARGQMAHPGIAVVGAALVVAVAALF